jgi:hypothetical protein
MDMVSTRYDNVTLITLMLQLGLRIGPIQRMGAVPGVIHTGRFFFLIPEIYIFHSRVMGKKVFTNIV